MFGSFRCDLLISLGVLPLLSLLIAVFATILVDAEQPGPCIFGHVPDQTVWLKGTLTIKFNATKACHTIVPFRDGDWVTYFRRPSSNDMHIIDVSPIDERFNNATMTLKATNSSGSELNSTEFKVYTVDNVSAVTNLSYSSNCTHTTVGWLSPCSQGLNVTDYFYVQRLNDTIVESGVTVDSYVVFNLTTLPANEPGSLSVWARAPPGNGTVTNASIVAALAPNVSYSTDVAIVSQKAILILDVKVNPSCPPSYPTGATIWFSCVPDFVPSVRPVCIGANESTVEIYSDAIETVHIGCSATVTISNLSGKNISESFIINTTDVQLLDAKPSKHGAIDITIKMAKNSSLIEIPVNITNSIGELVDCRTANRSLQKRMVKLTTDILPKDLYTISVPLYFNKSLSVNRTINITINITRSDYSTPSITLSLSSSIVVSSTTAVPSPTRTHTPTNDTLIGIVVAIAVIAIVVIIIILALALYVKRRHRRGGYGVEHSLRNKPLTEFSSIADVEYPAQLRPNGISSEHYMNGNTSIVPQTPQTSTNAEAASTDTDETASSSRTLAKPDASETLAVPKETTNITTKLPAEASSLSPLTLDSRETEVAVTYPPSCVVAEPTNTTETESTDANVTSTGPATTDTSVTPSSPKAILTENAALNVNIPLTTEAESTDKTLTAAATVTEPSSEHEHFPTVPTTGAIQATGVVQKTVFVSTGGLTTRPGSFSTIASLFQSKEPTEQQAATSAEDEEFLAPRNVLPTQSSMSEMIAPSYQSTDVPAAENSTVGSDKPLMDMDTSPSTAHKPFGSRALAAVRKVSARIPALLSGTTETKQAVLETTATASANSEQPLIPDKEPPSPSYGAVTSDDKELSYRTTEQEETQHSENDNY